MSTEEIRIIQIVPYLICLENETEDGVYYTTEICGLGEDNKLYKWKKGTWILLI